ncbi:MAG: hypothetical protein ABI672_03615 [Vicinamibacteria bacterium]
MRIKGTSISSFLAFLEAEYTPPRARAFIATLDPDLRRRCEGLVLASAFYPYADLETLAQRARTHFEGSADFFVRSGAFNADFGLSGVYAALLARPTPFDFLKAVERAWGQFSDTGSATVEMVSDGKAKVRIEGLTISPVLCDRQTGYLTRSLSLAGAKELKVKKGLCVQKGDKACEWTVSWDAATSPQSRTQTSALRRPAVI